MYTMKWFFVRLGIAVLSIVSFPPCFAQSTKTLYGLEYAQDFNSQDKGSFYIQAASFSHQFNADRYQQLLQSRTMYPVKVSHQKNVHIVLIGPIHSSLELRKTANSLIQLSIKNTTHTQSTSKIQNNHISAQSNEVIPAVMIKSSFTPALSTSANWFVGVGAGAEFSSSQGNIYVNNGSFFPPPYKTDVYSTKQPTSGLVNFSAGRRWEHLSQWFPSYSLGLLYQHSFLRNVRGTVTQYSLPQLSNYNYNWKLSSDILLASAKVNLYAKNQFSPYITVGLGGAFTHSNYNETALSGVTPRTSPGFSGTSRQFAYNAGAGLDFRASNHLIINFAYL